MKKFFTAFLISSAISAFAFDWPQTQIVQSDQFYSYFGQLRGGSISNSLIFSDPSEVKAADNGRIAIFIQEYDDASDFFPSTLGNALIISHDDNLMTVYGNISSQQIEENVYEAGDIQTGTIIGLSGNSAWQQGHSSLEFQVIDVKNNTSINPRILMPRIGKELPLYFGDVTLMNKNGRRFNAATQNVIPAGVYRVYKKRQSIAAPYKTRLAINGTVVDQLSYDVLRQNENQICVPGKKNYPKSVIYPTEDMQLIGEATLTPGKNALQLVQSDILGKETPATYIISVY